MPKFLLIRFSSIGDIVLTSPVIRCLTKQIPGSEVHFLTKEVFIPILQHNPYISKIHCLNSQYEQLVEALKQEDFDFIIDLHHNLRTLKLKTALGKPSRSFHKLNIEKWLLTALKINLLPQKHIVDRYLNTLKPWKVVNDQEGLDYFLGPLDEVQAEDIPVSHSAGFIALVIGATYATKRLSLAQLQAICMQIDHPIMLLGGKEDILAGDAIAAQDPIKIYNACGKFTLNESADLVRKAKLVITHDTGLMHIAAAFKKPIACIWGNTVPAFGMAPYYGHHSVPHLNFEIKHLSCRPCSKIGFQQCPAGHFKCMANQNIPQIAAAAMKMISH